MPPFSAQAMLLAAGRGERMRPLTDACPKPLLQVRGKPLMQWPIEALVAGGVRRLVVNTAWLGDQITARFGAQPALTALPALSTLSAAPDAASLSVRYSNEGHDFGAALETAGGIVRALPMLADVFWVVAGDVFAPDFAFSNEAVDRFAASGRLAHLWLVPNPPHNPRGDFGLSLEGLATNEVAGGPAPRFTFSTYGLYRAALFAPPCCTIPPGNPDGTRAALAPVLRAAIDRGQVGAELYTGAWTDVGTPERLAMLNAAP